MPRQAGRSQILIRNSAQVPGQHTTFAQLVADGWIGSSGTGTNLIKEQIEASRAGQREPILAFASGEVPKARRT
jgi:hypothetical protein